MPDGTEDLTPNVNSEPTLSSTSGDVSEDSSEKSGGVVHPEPSIGQTSESCVIRAVMPDGTEDVPSTAKSERIVTSSSGDVSDDSSGSGGDVVHPEPSIGRTSESCATQAIMPNSKGEVAQSAYSFASRRSGAVFEDIDI